MCLSLSRQRKCKERQCPAPPHVRQVAAVQGKAVCRPASEAFLEEPSDVRRFLRQAGGGSGGGRWAVGREVSHRLLRLCAGRFKKKRDSR